MPCWDGHVKSSCLQAHSGSGSINLLLLLLIRIVAPVIFKGNQIAIKAVLSEIACHRITALDGYIYCSRKLKKLPKKDIAAEALKQKVLIIKQNAIEYALNGTSIPLPEWGHFFLFADPYDLVYAKSQGVE